MRWTLRRVPIQAPQRDSATRKTRAARASQRQSSPWRGAACRPRPRRRLGGHGGDPEGGVDGLDLEGRGAGEVALPGVELDGQGLGVRAPSVRTE